MLESDLHPRWLGLVFPQWQGAGDARPIRDGCDAVAARIRPCMDTATVPVESHLGAPVSGIGALRTVVEHARRARGILAERRPDRIFLCGGDCGVELVPVSYVNERYQHSIGVVWFDAHADSNTPATSPSGNLHGMPLRILQGEGAAPLRDVLFSELRADQIVLAGVRDMDPGERDYIEAAGIPVVTSGALDAHGIGAFGTTLDKFANLYVHVDCDVMEPGRFPHVWCPVPGGVEPGRLIALLGELRTRHAVVGGSLVEYVPRGGGSPDVVDGILTAGFGFTPSKIKGAEDA